MLHLMVLVKYNALKLAIRGSTEKIVEYLVDTVLIQNNVTTSMEHV